MVLVELAQTIFVHLNSTDELFLLHVDMCNIQPDVAEFRRCLAHLSKYISGFVYATLMREYRTDAIRCPDVLRVVSQNLLVHGQCPILMSLLPFLVLSALMQRLQPNVSQRYQGVSIGAGRRILQDPLELLLAGAPLHLGQMQIAQQRPRVRMLVIDPQGVLEPIGRLVYLPLVPGHAAESQVAVHVIRMLLQNVFVQLLSTVEHAQRLVEPR